MQIDGRGKTASLRITRTKFKAGRKVNDKNSLEIYVGPVLVLVGPNNAGKSLALREIANWCFGEDAVGQVVSETEVDFPKSYEETLALLEPLKTKRPDGRAEAPDSMWVASHLFRGGQPSQTEVRLTDLASAIQAKNPRQLRYYTTAWYTIRLDGRTRFNLVADQPTGDLQGYPQNHLWALFANDAARERARKLIEEAFNLYFVIDPTALQLFRIRMSNRPPADTLEEQALDNRARQFHAAAGHINEFSDGVQAFVGIVAAILSLGHRILLIDEPEAFLFPPLARRLGANLAEITTERNATLVVATHSSEFLMGCLEKAQVSVVRLTYQNGLSTARNLSASDLRQMMNDPLLRSSKVLDALFHQGVVATESDTDRAFYDEINRRLQAIGRGMRDALFINAQNKQTEHKMVGPLRRIGVPAAAILDLDFLEEHGSNWRNLLDAALVPDESRAHLQEERDAVCKAFGQLNDTSELRPIKRIGVAALEGEGQSKSQALLPQLAEYGVFLVPCGQLENWLKPLGISGHGSDWLVKTFSRLGPDENDPSYVRPAAGGVWGFMDKIASWTNDANRKSI